jgi:hypothetical protein
MNVSFARYASGLGAALIALAGCGGAGSPPAGVPEAPSGTAPAKESFKSYMLPQARTAKRLLYVSSFYYGIVHVFDYETHAAVGLIAGLEEATGQCVDGKGDVWISLADPQEVVEYPRASLKQIRAVHTSARPFGCSVAPNGDLAVANFDEGSSPGSVQVFKPGSDSPATYTCSGFGYYPFSPGYDDENNLYVEAEVSLQETTVGLCELPAHGNALAPVTVNVPLHYGGSAMWDGTNMTISDVSQSQSYRDTSYIYRVAASPSGGLTVVGTTEFPNSNVKQPFIVGWKNTPLNRKTGGIVVAGSNNHIAKWTYPDGRRKGVPFKMVPAEVPFGQAVSIGP